jgi:hypothetical protein
MLESGPGEGQVAPQPDRTKWLTTSNRSADRIDDKPFGKVYNTIYK